MRTADQWFDLYGQSHQNPVNKAIHWVCIPLIVLSTLGLFQAVPDPFAPAWLHWGTLVVIAALGFYATFSATITVGMALVGAGMLAVNGMIAASGWPVLWVSLGVFAVAWAVQFVGHEIEGKKPSFIQDVQFLLVGPAWLLQFVYRKVGIPIVLRRSPSSPSAAR